jgi:hypothetical protein
MNQFEVNGEPIQPMVRAILDEVMTPGDGVAFVNHYASWVKRLREISPDENRRVFVQLAVLAKQFHEVNCKSVARSLATLSCIGLPRRKKLNSGDSEN